MKSMKLAQYLKEKNETASAFAVRLNVTRSTVCRLLATGKTHRRPSLDLAVRIKVATGGKVEPKDWKKPKEVPASPTVQQIVPPAVD